MTRRRAAWIAGGLALVVVALLAVNEAGNASARAELGPACACARASVDDTIAGTGELFYELFEDDAGEVRAFMRGEVSELCDELDAALAPGAWNLGRSWRPTAHPERVARVRAILERARPRCPAVHPSPALCDALFEGMAPSGAPSVAIATWEWPAAIERSMCLDPAARQSAP